MDLVYRRALLAEPQVGYVDLLDDVHAVVLEAPDLAKKVERRQRGVLLVGGPQITRQLCVCTLKTSPKEPLPRRPRISKSLILDPIKIC